LAHSNTVYSQLLQLVSRHEFEQLANAHHVGQRLRKISRWDQFLSLFMAQLSGRQSLRDIEANMNAQRRSHYHLGCRRVSKSSLPRVNERHPYTLYEALFAKLVKRCQGYSPKHKFRFKNPLISLDSSLIELSLKLFPWSDHNRTKGAVKLHVGLDHCGHFPAFATITDGRNHQAKPEDPRLCGQLQECGADSDLGRAVHVPGPELSEISIQVRLVSAAGIACAADQPVFETGPVYIDQTFTTTGGWKSTSNAVMGLMKMWDSSGEEPQFKGGFLAVVIRPGEELHRSIQ
jgi:hypothetical protein